MYDVWFNFYYGFSESPETENETEALGLALIRAFRKTVIKIERYIVQTSLTSHFVGKYLLYKVKCFKNFENPLFSRSIIYFVEKSQNFIFSLGTCLFFIY